MSLLCKLGIHNYVDDKTSASIYGKLEKQHGYRSRDYILIYYSKCKRCGLEVIHVNYVEFDIRWCGYDKQTKKEIKKQVWVVQDRYPDYCKYEELDGETLEDKKYDLAFKKSWWLYSYLDKITDLTEKEFDLIEVRKD